MRGASCFYRVPARLSDGPETVVDIDLPRPLRSRVKETCTLTVSFFHSPVHGALFLHLKLLTYTHRRLATFTTLGGQEQGVHHEVRTEPAAQPGAGMGIVVHRLQGTQEDHKVGQERDASRRRCGLGQYGETGIAVGAENLTTIQAFSTP